MCPCGTGGSRAPVRVRPCTRPRTRPQLTATYLPRSSNVRPRMCSAPAAVDSESMWQRSCRILCTGVEVMQTMAAQAGRRSHDGITRQRAPSSCCWSLAMCHQGASPRHAYGRAEVASPLCKCVQSHARLHISRALSVTVTWSCREGLTMGGGCRLVDVVPGTTMLPLFVRCRVLGLVACNVCARSIQQSAGRGPSAPAHHPSVVRARLQISRWGRGPRRVTHPHTPTAH